MVDTEAFHRNLGEMLLAARDSLRAGRYLPSLVLMYSLIDSVAWAASEPADRAVRTRFEAWVKRWLLPELSASAPEITATDLYAARCAVIHTLTGDSDLSRTGKAKKVIYAWGTARLEVLRSAAEKNGYGSTHVSLHCNDFFQSLWTALEKFLDAANSDPQLASRLDEAAGAHYANIPDPRPDG